MAKCSINGETLEETPFSGTASQATVGIDFDLA